MSVARIGAEETNEDVRDLPRRSKLPCGARYCHRCTEECGVVVNAWMMRDLALEDSEQ